jgi:hypothetical protein
MGKTQQHGQARDEASRMRRAMLDACGKSLRHRYGQELENSAPPSISRLIEELKQAESRRHEKPAALKS